MHNFIITKYYKHLETKHLEFVPRVVLEGPTYNIDHILVEATKLSRTSTKLRYLYPHPVKYLVGRAYEDAQNLDLDII